MTDSDIKLKFGHYYNSETELNYIFHLKNNESNCNDSLYLCNKKGCFKRHFNFKKICKKCWEMLSKKEQEELIHYFCVKKLKG